MSETEYHVASFVVSTRPEQGDETAARINALPGLEVHVNEGGKMVVTGEAPSRHHLADMAETLKSLDHVLQVSPVYHEYASTNESENQQPWT